MADLTKLMKRPQSRLGAPPPAEEASLNLSAPEIAPAAPEAQAPEDEGREIVQLGDHRRRSPSSKTKPHARVDGRSLRRTGRTVALSLRVSPEYDERMRKVAVRDHIILAEVLERGLEAYEKQRSRS
jgi:hypothetical protein